MKKLIIILSSLLITFFACTNPNAKGIWNWAKNKSYSSNFTNDDFSLEINEDGTEIKLINVLGGITSSLNLLQEGEQDISDSNGNTGTGKVENLNIQFASNFIYIQASLTSTFLFGNITPRKLQVVITSENNNTVFVGDQFILNGEESNTTTSDIPDTFANKLFYTDGIGTLFFLDKKIYWIGDNSNNPFLIGSNTYNGIDATGELDGSTYTIGSPSVNITDNSNIQVTFTQQYANLPLITLNLSLLGDGTMTRN